MADVKPDIRAIFCEALDQKSPEEISQYLDAACGDDAQLRAQVEALLRSHGEAGDFLGGSASVSAVTLNMPGVAEKPGTQIGPYKLLQQIGEGGMGTVYMAEQTEPVKRRVALKIIKPGMDTRQVIARFEAERQALAMMDHPHIARVFGAGTTDSGRPYFVMELVNGIPITRYCDEQHLTPRERLELFVPVCQAVQHAHQKGIIHRDLKPSNILVALYDHLPVPKVIDFGVAKATSQSLTEKTLFTELGQIVGTLEYMSPEQAQRNQLDIDTRSDVYSLGIVLYELLTGTTPVERSRLRTASYDEILRIIREEETPRPSIRLSSIQTLPSIAANRRTEPLRLRKLVRGELDWIVMRALEKDRARRYDTPNGFAADIQRYLDDEAVIACPPSAAYRFRKFARRNKAILMTALLIATALLLGLVGTTHQMWRAIRAEHHAEQERGSAQKQERIATWERHRAVAAERDAIEQRDRARREKRISDAMRLAAQSQSVRKQFPVRSALLAVEAVNATRSHNEPIVPVAHESLLHAVGNIGGRALVGHQGTVSELTISRDGRWLVTGGYDTVARLWDLHAEDPASRSRLLSGDKAVISDDSRRLITYGNDTPISVWNLESGDLSKPELRLADSEAYAFIGSVVISPNGRWLAASGRRAPTLLWDLDADAPDVSRTLRGPHERAGEMVMSPDGKWLVAGFGESLQLWDLSTNELSAVTQRKIPRPHGFGSFVITNDSRWLIVNSDQQELLLWDLRNGADVTPVVLPHGGDAMGRFIATSDSRWLVTADLKVQRPLQSTLRLWDLQADDPFVEPIDFGRQYPGVSLFATIGRWVAAGCYDGTTLLWDLKARDPAASFIALRGHSESIKAVTFSRNERWLATGSADVTGRLWDLKAKDPSADSIVLRGHESTLSSIAISGDSRWLVTAAQEQTPRLWDLEAHNPASSLELRTAGTRLEVGRQARLVTPGSGHALLWWDLSATEPSTLATLPHKSKFAHFQSIAMDAQGRWLATTNDNHANLFDLDAADPFSSPLVFPHEFVHSVAISRDGRWLVTAGGPYGRQQPANYEHVRVWDLLAEDPTASPVKRLRRESAVGRVALTPDGRWLATDGRGARLWDLWADGSSASFQDFEASIRSISISPNGRWFVVGGTDGIAYVRELTPDGPSQTPWKLIHNTGTGRSDHVWLNFWSQDSRWLVTAGDEGVVFVWSFNAAIPTNPTYILSGHKGSVRSGAFGPNNRWLATAESGPNRAAILWDLQADSPASSAVCFRDRQPKTVAISRDGHWLFTGSYESTQLWDLRIDSLINRAHALAGRELTAEERQQYVPDVGLAREVLLGPGDP